MIYFSLLIPFIAVIILSWGFHKKVLIWERLLVFFVPVIVIVISKVAATRSLTADTEYWNSYATKAVYYEFWDEWIKKTCCVKRDSTGNCIEEKDCSYVENHPAYWEVTDNIGRAHTYNQGAFETAARVWGNRVFKNMQRDYHRIDGDAYVTSYNGVFEHTIPLCMQHTYENRVQCSRSVFNFEEVDTSEIRLYKLFNYPGGGLYHYNPLLGVANSEASNRLRWHNAHMGSYKQVHMLLLVFNDVPYQAALKQEQYWKKGNKNEFILCIGRKKDKTEWAYVISWTDVEILKKRVARKAKEMEYNLVGIVDMMAREVKGSYIRKQFSDFNYIQVEPSNRAVIVTFIITLLVTLGISIFVVLNDKELL